MAIGLRRSSLSMVGVVEENSDSIAIDSERLLLALESWPPIILLTLKREAKTLEEPLELLEGRAIAAGPSERGPDTKEFDVFGMNFDLEEFKGVRVLFLLLPVVFFDELVVES